MRLATWAMLLAVPAFAAELGIGTPAAAYFFDEAARAIRPVGGVAGAAIAGTAKLAGAEAAAVAPSGHAAVVRRDGELYWVRDLATSPSLTAIAGAIGSADLVVWANDGRCAAVASAATRQVQKICSPESAEPAVSLEGSLRSLHILAIAADGRNILAGGAAENGDSLYVVSLENGVRPAAHAASVTAAMFRADGAVLYAGEDGIHEATAGGIRRLAGSDAVRRPVAMAEADGGLLILDDEGRSVALLSAGGTEVRRAALDAPGRTLQAIGPGCWVVGRSRVSPLFLVDTARSEMVFFIPEN